MVAHDFAGGSYISCSQSRCGSDMDLYCYILIGNGGLRHDGELQAGIY